jgi:thymidylate synthase
MYFKGEHIDDLLRASFSYILEHGEVCSASRGRFFEIRGASLELTDPRARLSRSETKGKPYSCLGELLWYLSGSNDVSFIEWYVAAYADDAEPDGTLRGAYGPRIFSTVEKSQFQVVVDLLTAKPTSRRAVIQVFSKDDLLGKYKEIPCTTTIQFLIRNNRLECIATMRSNDAFKGLPHDLFCFTMIQELMAREIGVEVGSYRHYAGSFHIYEDQVNSSIEYLNEGFQSIISMPDMPEGSQTTNIRRLIEVEKRIRTTKRKVKISHLPSYWADLARLLDAYRNSKNEAAISVIAADMESDFYRYYLERRKTVGRKKKKVAC